jgi:hypothetical protein
MGKIKKYADGGRIIGDKVYPNNPTTKKVVKKETAFNQAIPYAGKKFRDTDQIVNTNMHLKPAIYASQGKYGKAFLAAAENGIDAATGIPSAIRQEAAAGDLNWKDGVRITGELGTELLAGSLAKYAKPAYRAVKSNSKALINTAKSMIPSFEKGTNNVNVNNDMSDKNKSNSRASTRSQHRANMKADRLESTRETRKKAEGSKKMLIKGGKEWSMDAVKDTGTLMYEAYSSPVKEAVNSLTGKKYSDGTKGVKGEVGKNVKNPNPVMQPRATARDVEGYAKGFPDYFSKNRTLAELKEGHMVNGFHHSRGMKQKSQPQIAREAEKRIIVGGMYNSAIEAKEKSNKQDREYSKRTLSKAAGLKEYQDGTKGVSRVTPKDKRVPALELPSKEEIKKSGAGRHANAVRYQQDKAVRIEDSIKTDGDAAIAVTGSSILYKDHLARDARKKAGKAREQLEKTGMTYPKYSTGASKIELDPNAVPHTKGKVKFEMKKSEMIDSSPMEKYDNLARGGTTAVAKYQEMLNKKTGGNLKIDGAFGELTTAQHNKYKGISSPKKTSESTSSSSKVNTSTTTPKDSGSSSNKQESTSTAKQHKHVGAAYNNLPFKEITLSDGSKVKKNPINGDQYYTNGRVLSKGKMSNYRIGNDIGGVKGADGNVYYSDGKYFKYRTKEQAKQEASNSQKVNTAVKSDSSNATSGVDNTSNTKSKDDSPNRYLQGAASGSKGQMVAESALGGISRRMMLSGGTKTKIVGGLIQAGIHGYAGYVGGKAASQDKDANTNDYVKGIVGGVARSSALSGGVTASTSAIRGGVRNAAATGKVQVGKAIQEGMGKTMVGSSVASKNNSIVGDIKKIVKDGSDRSKRMKSVQADRAKHKIKIDQQNKIKAENKAKADAIKAKADANKGAKEQEELNKKLDELDNKAYKGNKSKAEEFQKRGKTSTDYKAKQDAELARRIRDRADDRFNSKRERKMTLTPSSSAPAAASSTTVTPTPAPAPKTEVRMSKKDKKAAKKAMRLKGRK